MKYPILFVFVFLFFQNLQAQVGVTAGYRNFQAADWYTALAEAQGVQFSKLPGRSIGLDYWFRLKNKRIEFLPQLSYATFEETLTDEKLEHRLASFHFNTNIYLFDLEGDCDCPTWSKDGNFFQKGFFIQLSPGYSFFENNFTSNDVETVSGNGRAFELGAGVGVDIGISDFLTVSPVFKYIFAPNATWEISNPLIGVTTNKIDSPYRQIFAGIRLGFRWKK